MQVASLLNDSCNHPRRPLDWTERFTQWICSPACTELEQVMLDWMSKLLGLSETFWMSSKMGGGIILVWPPLPLVSVENRRSPLGQGSASECVLTAAIAARERALRYLADHLVAAGSETGTVPGSDIPLHVRDQYGHKLVMYGSTQTHSVGVKVRGGCPSLLRR